MFNNIDKDAFIYALVAFVGFIGGILGIGSGNTKLKGSGWSRFISGTVATLSSMLVCLTVYEIVFFMFHSAGLGIALGGWGAWLGAEWAKKKMDKFLDKKIESISEKRDDEFEDDERREYEEVIHKQN